MDQLEDVVGAAASEYAANLARLAHVASVAHGAAATATPLT
jgi:hypothetical protein